MPLIRYEMRCEHSLAKPELYRAAAASNNSQGLLEGRAVAGMLGIVRQLGDLAEFAGEIFHDLHEQLTALRVRGNGLKSRLLKLEVELPGVEKVLRTSTEQIRHSYIAGLQWHPILCTDQNHCTKSELPNFIRNFYDNCRGPPRLFLLDKFDVAGEGACMQRYTDPSFYKTTCPGSLFKEVRHQSRCEKRRARLGGGLPQEKDRWCKSGEENLGSFLHFRKQSSSLDSKSAVDVSGAVSWRQIEQEHQAFAPQNLVLQDVGQDGDEPRTTGELSSGDMEVAKVSSSLEFPQHHKTPVDGEGFLEEEEESASDGEHFEDALATMDLELESEDSETQAIRDVVSSLSNSRVHTESPQEKLSEGLGHDGANLHGRTRLLGKELLEASSLEGLSVGEDLQLQEEENVRLTQMNLLEVALADVGSSLSNSRVHTESPQEKLSVGLGLNGANLQDRTGLLGKELLEASSLEGLNVLEDLQLQEEENARFKPINLLEVDDDLGYEKYSPSFLKDFAPSSLNHFAHRTNMESATDKASEALDNLPEKLPKSTDIEERLQAGLRLNKKAHSSRHLPVHLQASKGESDHDSFSSRLVRVSEATEGVKDLSRAQNTDTRIKETGSVLVEESETMEEYADEKQTKFVPYSAVPNSIANTADTTKTTSSTDDNSSSEYRRSIEETYNPFTSSSSSISYSVSESPSRESIDFSPVPSPLMSPWSHLSVSCVYLDSSESDDSFRIHSVQSPPLVAPLLMIHSTAQKQSEAQQPVATANVVVT